MSAPATPHAPAAVDAASTAQLAQAAVIALLAFSVNLFAATLAGTQPSPPPEKLPFVATNVAPGLAANAQAAPTP